MILRVTREKYGMHVLDAILGFRFAERHMTR